VIDQHAPHQPRGDADEMRPVPPLDAVCVNQPHERLVDQRCRLQRVVAPLASHVASGEPPQLCLDQRQQRLQRLLVAVAPGLQQLGDAGRPSSHVVSG